jgi:hypothetical protein
MRLKLAALSIPFVAIASYLVATTAVSAEKRDDIYAQFEKCRVLGDDQARLTCLKNLLPSTDETAASPSDSWKLVRTPNPAGGHDAVSIMRTADTARSDPDLAGLMIRCADKSGLEAVLALVKPLPPRGKRDVVVTAGTAEVVLHADVTSAGAAVVLPIETSTFTTGTWHNLKELAVNIKDSDGDIRGVISLGGIGPAMVKLSANCLQ